MKVAHFITSLKVGGAEVGLYNLLKHLKDGKQEHFGIYFYDGPIVSKIESLGIKTYKINGLFSNYDPLAWFRFCKLIKKISPDIIHSSLWSANIMGRLVSKIFNIPIICDIHGDVFFQGKFRNLLEKMTILIPKNIVVVSKSVKKALEDNIISKIKNPKKRELLKSKISLIQNGVDVDFLINKQKNEQTLRQDLGFCDDDFIVGSVGRLEEIKSYDVLIKAFSLFLSEITSNKENFRKPKLCLVGDGSQKNKLVRLANDLGINSHVKFVGWQSDTYKFYSIFDCFVLSSKSEGLSIALLEALSFGLPLISTHLSADHDVIVDGKNGFLTPVEDEESLCLAMKKLYFDSKMVAEMKNANINLARNNFNIRKIANSYSDLYAKTISVCNK
jgi:glycosyltransferase involved in cell wall biosynthesis